MYGAAPENICAPTANTRSRISSGKQVATHTPSKQTVERQAWSYDCSAVSSHMWCNVVTRA